MRQMHGPRATDQHARGVASAQMTCHVSIVNETVENVVLVVMNMVDVGWIA